MHAPNDEPAASDAVLFVTPTEEEWGSRDDRWQSDVFELEQVLRFHAGDDVRHPTPREGDKGVEWSEVVVDLVSAGVFTSVVEGLKVWLAKKPDRRRLRLRYRVGDETGEITADATNIDSADVSGIAIKAFDQSHG